MNEDEVANVLAYWRCRINNPKAAHPTMGYFAFSDEQHEYLVSQQRDNARKVIAMLEAGAA